jgi:hypothetical protein
MTERVIRADQIDFSDEASTAVVSDSYRFVLPVPAFADGGEPLIHPETNATFTDRSGRPIEGRGIVFFDRGDRSWEVAPGDGSGAIVFSPITERQSATLCAALDRDDAAHGLTVAAIKRLIDYAYDALGVASSYSTTLDYVEAAMTRVTPGGRGGWGLYRRKAVDVCRAVYIAGDGAFLGPAATPQRFKGGAVIVRHGADVRLVQGPSFETTYRFLDGRPARVVELARQAPRSRRSTAARARSSSGTG